MCYKFFVLIEYIFFLLITITEKQRLNRSSCFERHSNKLLIRKACGSDENRSSNGFSTTPNKIFNEEVLSFLYPLNFNFLTYFLLFSPFCVKKFAEFTDL